MLAVCDVLVDVCCYILIQTSISASCSALFLCASEYYWILSLPGQRELLLLLDGHLEPQHSGDRPVLLLVGTKASPSVRLTARGYRPLPPGLLTSLCRMWQLSDVACLYGNWQEDRNHVHGAVHVSTWDALPLYETGDVQNTRIDCNFWKINWKCTG